jgi:squalene-hopene/tetraprenyl-beta-curcumene cyclase
MLQLKNSLDRALSALLAQRNPAGYWEGRLASSPLATAVSLCALDEHDISTDRRSKSHEYLAKTQNADGGWGDTEISKSNLAASLLTLCADAMQPFLSNDARTRANAYVEKLGGVGEGLSRVYGKDLTFQVPIRMTAAFAGLKTEWTDVDALPFELALAPRSLMGALRLPVVSYALPALVCVGLSRHAKAPSWMLPLRWLRSALTDKALAAILKMQPASGGYLEATPITAFCCIGLKAAGRGDHPVAQNARKFLIDTQRDDGSWPVEVNLSVWNTTRAIDVLAAGGLLETALTETERATTRDWILAQQCRERSVYSDTQPGGWGWNHLSGSVPDGDDTAGAIIALQALGLPREDLAVEAGRRWLLRLQNQNGGWPTFCRGWEKLPFDQSAPDLTAHALRALGPSRETFEAPDLEEGMPQLDGWKYLENNQRLDGSFAPLWFGCERAPDERNYTYGTAHFLFAAQSGKGRDRALQWLLKTQNADGGFGGCAGAPSTAEETGLALRALVAHGYTLDDQQCQRAAQWLIDHQREDGSWNPAPIGFYFAVLWYYEELYSLMYAVGGLGALARTRQHVEAVTAV